MGGSARDSPEMSQVTGRIILETVLISLVPSLYVS
jgi:hypothetical protein